VKRGFKVVGIARGPDKEPLARKLGAHHYIDSQSQDPSAELQKLGGAKVILTTVTNGDAICAVQGGLGLNGTLLVIGAVDAGVAAGVDRRTIRRTRSSSACCQACVR
jgi:D-arabinose 1-dehydrogenase-like Zn-dependent alcohol dehydrogenase